MLQNRTYPSGKDHWCYKPELHIPKFCACGCGNLVLKNCYNYLLGHHKRNKKPWNYDPTTPEPKYCLCGCGSLVKNPKHCQYVHGHNKKGLTKFTKQLCKCGCGQLTNLGRSYINHHNTKDSHKNGYIKQDAESKTKISNTLKQYYNNPTNRQKRIDITTDLWKSSEYILKQTNGRGYFKNKYMNKSEQLLQDILNQISPNRFKYNGNFSYCRIVSGHIPDFIDENNIVIEMFGCFYHRCSKHYNKEDTEQTLNIRKRNEKIMNDYKNSNIKYLIIWEHELKNKETVTNKINQFIGSEIYANSK